MTTFRSGHDLGQPVLGLEDDEAVDHFSDFEEGTGSQAFDRFSDLGGIHLPLLSAGIPRLSARRNLR